MQPRAQHLSGAPLEKSRDRTSGGAGVGLAIVERIVEDAGGRVGATSEGGWTTFWFRLPA